MNAYKCDRCGKYYDDSTSLIGPTLYKSKNTRMFDLCEECKASLTRWLTSVTDKREDEFYE